MAAERPLPRQHIGLGLGFFPGSPGRAFQREAFGQLWHDLLEGDFQPVAVARLGLVFQGWPLAEVEVDQVLPFLRRASLQGYTGAGVATATGFAELGIEVFHGIEPALHGVAHAIGFARRQALLVGQVLDQGAAIVVADLQPMHDLHAGDAHQPAFRGLALVADAAVGVVAFRDVASHALVLQQARALLGRNGLGAQQCGGDQRQFTRMPPESSRLQGQTSTVVIIVLARFGTAGVQVTGCDTETVPGALKVVYFRPLGGFQGCHERLPDELERAISRQGVSS